MLTEIKDFPNYEIDDNGQVKNKKTGMFKKQTLDKSGYYTVTLYKNNKGKKLTIHRLLAASFLPNPNKLPTVNHIDGNKLNNHLTNLEWASYSENNQHAYDTGLKKVTEKMLNHAKTLKEISRSKNPYGSNRKSVIAIFGENVEITFPSVSIASDTLGINRSSIDRVLKGKREKTKGLKFKYEDDISC